MRGLGAFQMAQMKHRDASVVALCQHLRSAIDMLEQIASDPYRPPEKPIEEPLAAAPQPAPAPPEVSPDKITFSLKEAASSLGVGKSTLYKALADGHLTAIKLGNRTLIPADSLRAWISSMPARKRCRKS